jgi:hypothetical protein
MDKELPNWGRTKAKSAKFTFISAGEAVLGGAFPVNTLKRLRFA